jgi:hypothetical protein
MKGVVFTEFMDLVETGFGMEVADGVLTKGCPFSHGFTSVGTYDHHVLLNMVSQLSNDTGIATADLVHAFGRHLFKAFLRSYPESFVKVSSTFELLSNVEKVIHVEVRKLYSDAELPSFKFLEAEPGCFNLEYISSRPFALLAEGLIEASIEHFDEPLNLERIDLDGAPGTHALFRLTPSSPQTV